MKSLMLLNSKKIETIFDLIPRCKKFSKTVRDTIVVNTFTKLLLLRIVSFDRNRHACSWKGQLERTFEMERFILERSFQVVVFIWKIV